MRLWRRVGVDSLRPETKERGRGRQVVMTSTPVPVGWALAIRTGEVRDIGMRKSRGATRTCPWWDTTRFWSINAGPLSGFQVTAGRLRERERDRWL